MRVPRWIAWAVLTALGGPLLVGAGVLVVGAVSGDATPDPDFGDPGRTREELFDWSADDGPLPVLTDVSSEWGLDGFVVTSENQAAGGAAVGDLDGDGDFDLVVGGGDFAVFRNTGNDQVVWGGSWVEGSVEGAATTTFAGGDPSEGLLVAELSGDGLPDLLRLGYGPPGRATDDVVWVQQPQGRVFDPEPLPDSDRRSLAAEIADLDGDGLVDLWVTRDVGWADGGDSVYSRRGNDDGEWFDVAGELNLDREIDGMGVTVTDLDGNGDLDGYVSDVGENEVMIRREGTFRHDPSTGASRIRPPSAEASVVSSTWASETTDLNLDGQADLVIVNGGFVERQLLNKVPGTDVLVDDPPGILLGLGRGRFADVWPQLGLPWEGSSRGLALGDLDDDGDDDVVVVNHGDRLRVYRNDTRGDAVSVRPDAACEPTGAVLEVETPRGVIRTMLVQHTFLGRHAPGLSAGQVESATVTWGDGSEVTVEADNDPVVEVACKA